MCFCSYPYAASVGGTISNCSALKPVLVPHPTRPAPQPLSCHCQAYGYWQHCILGPGDHERRPWCDSSLPLLYSFVQKEYWHNGLFAYYQVRNIPNFLIALPILIWCVATIASYSRAMDRRVWLTLGLGPCADKVKARSVGFFTERVFVHFVYLAFLTFVAVCFMYIQCTTRFICASAPAVYWFASHSPTYMRLAVLYSFAYTAVGTVLFCNFYPWT